MRYFLILISMLVSFPSFAQTFGETRQYFGDWLAACRPSGYCSATAYDNPNPPEGSVADYILRVGRHEQEIYWEVSLTTVAVMPQEFSPMDFYVSDNTITFQQNFDYGAYSSINDFFFVSGQVQELLDQLIAGSRVAAQFTDENQTIQTANFSLSGLSAALLWIDEQQKRLGSERVAYAAPIGLTPVSPGFAQSLPADLIKQRTRDQNCEPFEDLPGAHRTIIDQVDEEHWVYFIPCSTGAYNAIYKAYEGNGTYFTPIFFADYYEQAGWTGTPYIVNPTYNKETNTLTSNYLGRGLGDCGSSGTWVWNSNLYVFSMLEYRVKEACGAQGEPGDFPIIFQQSMPQ